MGTLVTAFLLLIVLATIAGLGLLAYFQFERGRTLSGTISELTSGNAQLVERFRPIHNMDTENARLRAEGVAIRDAKERLAAEHKNGWQTYERLKKEVALLEENLEDISNGMYRPHFTYETSEAYKLAVEAIRSRQKEMIRQGKAATCSTTWTIGNSQRDGERMAKQYLKLLLRAFNLEADAAVSSATWNNFRVMNERLRKAFEAFNALGTVMQMSISVEYCQLKLEELRVAFEYEEKKQQEKEEQRRIKAQMREEEREQREADRAREEAEREESRYEKALQKARTEAEYAAAGDKAAFSARIAELELALAEAHLKRERAVAQAQLTKCGHVYIISNIGAFGDEVFKLGMTRRLEPLERVIELGDASVPFPFDVHAMIYSMNAPELEAVLHNHFWERRVNRANDRKEFFRLTLDELEQFCQQRGLQVEFTRIAEAKEYRQSVAELELMQSATQNGRMKITQDGNGVPVAVFS